jgi:hypothetical protein
MASRVQHQTARSAIDKPVMNDQWDDRIGTVPLGRSSKRQGKQMDGGVRF